MTTIREQIVQAAMSALNGPDKPAHVPACERVRAVGLNSTALPVMLMYPLKESVERANPTVVKRTFTFRVDCRAAALVADSLPADALVNDMLSWATKALAGNRMGGLAHDVDESNVTWSIETADMTYVEATIDFDVSYHTLRSDQERRS